MITKINARRQHGLVKNDITPGRGNWDAQRAIVFYAVRLIFATLAILMLILMPVRAQDGQGVSDDAVNAVAETMYCPTCENVPLDDCGTTTCIQWKEEIRKRLGEGWTRDQIVDEFVGRYGERVVGTPQDPFLRALSLITPWLLAVLILGVGVEIFRRNLSRRSNQPVTVAGGNPSAVPQMLSDDDYRKRIDHDLQDRR